MMTSRFAILSLLGIFGFAPASALAQGVEKPSELTFPLPNLAVQPVWRVTKVDPSGEITLKDEGIGDQSMVECYCLLFPVGKDAKGFARVQVTEVGTKEFLAKTSPEAARALAEGTEVQVFRPHNATTKQLKAIPAYVEFAKGQAAVDLKLTAARSTAFRVRSVNNLKQIGLAMHNFYATYEVLPPSVLRSPEGKPLVSWRVLILPFVEQQELYKQYDMTQPWDSPKNLKLLDRMPAVYRDPVYGDDKGHFTNYAVLVGENTPFPAEGVKMTQLGKIELHPKVEGTVGFAHVLDGLSNTICAVPVPPDRKIPWTKPEDLPFDENFPPLGQPGGIAAPYEVDGQKVAPILLMDGSVQTLPAKVQKPALDALCTRAGGEIVAADTFIRGAAAQRQAMATLVITIEGDKATATIR